MSLWILILLLFVEGAFLDAQTSAAQLNRTVENISAQRLNTMMERIMEGISVVVMKRLVKDKLLDVLTMSYLSKYIL